MRPAGFSSSAAVGGSGRPRPARGRERLEGREVGRGLANTRGGLLSSRGPSRAHTRARPPGTGPQPASGRSKFAFHSGSFLDADTRGSAMGEPVSRKRETGRPSGWVSQGASGCVIREVTTGWMDEMERVRGTHLYKVERKWGEGRPHWERYGWGQFESEIGAQPSESFDSQGWSQSPLPTLGS